MAVIESILDDEEKVMRDLLLERISELEQEIEDYCCAKGCSNGKGGL
ncbi:MAG: hypothetical protein QXS68_07785 [Candidatus Methanomethylicaceae archaeon]